MVILLIIAVTVTLAVPGLDIKYASAAEAEDTLAFYQVEPEGEVVKFPQPAPKPKPKPKPKPEPEPAYVPVSTSTSSAAVQRQAPVEATSGDIRYVNASAYSSTADQCSGDPFITASGTRVHWGTVAANFLPFGAKVRFPDYFGDQVFTIEDRTSTRYSDRADIWFPSRGEALQFGVRTLRIEIL
ncbi:hypothetical protein ACFL2D_00290 [Patescibacteria group bacterium]